MLGMLMRGDFLGFVILGVVLVGSIALHEFGHAFAADRLGDPTPRNQGRLTLNPLRHLDPLGTAMLVLAGFGWGKPVEFSLQNLRNRRTGPAFIALAGPGMNVLLAFGAVGLLAALRPSGASVVTLFIDQLLFLNLLLAVFNLIPIPPLDGSRLLSLALPPSKGHIIYFLDKWGFLILLVLVFFVLPRPLFLVVSRLAGLMLALVGYA